MKKTLKITIIFILIIVFLLLVYLFASNQVKKRQAVDGDANVYYPTAREAADWGAMMPLEPLEIEYLDDEEAIELGLSTSTDMQLQVVQRDEGGEVLEYKKVRGEEDLIRYKY